MKKLNKIDDFFWVGQKAFIRKGNEVLIAIDKETKKIDFPGGRIQKNEKDLDTSLKREVKEEFGINITVRDPFFRWIRTFPKNHSYYGKKVFLIGIECKYISGKIKISNTHLKYYWVGKNNYKKFKDNSDYYKALANYIKTKL